MGSVLKLANEKIGALSSNSQMEKSVWVLIVAPLIGHLTQSIQLAKLMLEKNNKLSFTVLVIELPIDPEGTKKVRSFIAGCNVERIDFYHLPKPKDTSHWRTTSKGLYLNQMLEFQKPHVREIVSRIEGFSGFIVDMTAPTMIDIADEFGVPSYVFFTSGAAFFGLMLHFQNLQDEQNQDVPEWLEGKCKELMVPSFVNRIPVSVLPTITTNKEQWTSRTLEFARGYRRAKGIIVNTFVELETFALDSFLKDSSYGIPKVPKIYPVGPILNRSPVDGKNHLEAMEWLDVQPASSVIFVCSGSLGSFNGDQMKEIAIGLERSGHRFLWVLRQPSSNKGGFPGECEDHAANLPEGFLDRTASFGKVVGWVRQLDVLSHPALGGFVSHCGWNSILESIWCGVPIATWPHGGEQQLTAFQLVKELRMAVEISLDYDETKVDQAIVRAEQIEKGLNELMNGENEEVRKRVKYFSEKSKLAVKDGGSSHLMFEELVEIICSN